MGQHTEVNLQQHLLYLHYCYLSLSTIQSCTIQYVAQLPVELVFVEFPLKAKQFLLFCISLVVKTFFRQASTW